MKTVQERYNAGVNELMDDYKTQNKIGSVESESKPGEVVEFQALLQNLT